MKGADYCFPELRLQMTRLMHRPQLRSHMIPRGFQFDRGLKSIEETGVPGSDPSDS